MKPYLYSVVIASLLFASCSPKIPFTQSVRDQYKLSPQELSKIQFYISGPIVLRKGTIQEREKATEDGKLVIKSGKSIDQVVFKARTRGALDRVEDNASIRVSFEDGAEKNLVFSSVNEHSGYYRLMSKLDKGKNIINYGGETYFVASGLDQPVLLFKMKSLKSLKVTEKVVKGKKVQ